MDGLEIAEVPKRRRQTETPFQCPRHAVLAFILICPRCSKKLWDHIDRRREMDERELRSGASRPTGSGLSI